MSNITKNPHMPAEERFWARVEKRDCWTWTGTKDKHGYGYLNVSRKPTFAHRFAYQLLVGPIGTGLELDHLCRNPSCVNPAHLEAVSHRTNVLRGTAFSALNAQKTACPAGHSYSVDNTYISRDGYRACRTCHRERMRRAA